GGGLPGAVRPEQPEELPGADLEVESVDGHEVAEAAAHRLGLDDRGCARHGHLFHAHLPAYRTLQPAPETRSGADDGYRTGAGGAGSVASVAAPSPATPPPGAPSPGAPGPAAPGPTS